ncbi:zinc finger protein 638, partial [Rhinophrynus dorsalis]
MNISGLNQQAMSMPGLNQQAMSMPGLNQQAMNLPGLNQQAMSMPGLNQQAMNLHNLSQQAMAFANMNRSALNSSGMGLTGLGNSGIGLSGIGQSGMKLPMMGQSGMAQAGMNFNRMPSPGMNQGGLGFLPEMKRDSFGIRPHGLDSQASIIGGSPDPMGMKMMQQRAPMHVTPERGLGPQAFQQRFVGSSPSVRPGQPRMQSQNLGVPSGMNMMMKSSPSDLMGKDKIQLQQSTKQWESRSFGNVPQGMGMKQMSSPQVGQINEPQSRYTNESASSILESFGLSNEDLEELSRYPDDQLTPANMPVILRDIRLRKMNRSASTPDQSVARRPVDVLPSKVIDYGHSSKFQFNDPVPTRSRRDEKGFRATSPKSKFVSQKSNISKQPVAPKTQPEKPGNKVMENKTLNRKNQPVRATQEQPKSQGNKNDVPPAEQTAAKIAQQPEVPATGQTDVQKASHPDTQPNETGNVISQEASQAQANTSADTTKFPKGSWAPALSQAEAQKMKRLPTPSMMNDYYAASPRIFPHICSLCNIECRHLKDWIKHQNTTAHIESCRQLRQQYPDWNPQVLSTLRNESKPDGETKRSKSKSSSPRRSKRSGSRHRTRRSRSRSPRSSGRARSRSRSPRRTRHSPKRSRSPRRKSRSPRRSLSPKRPRRGQSSHTSSKSPDKKAVDAAVKSFIEATDGTQEKNKSSKASSNGKKSSPKSPDSSAKDKKPASSSAASAKKTGSSSSTEKKPSSTSSVTSSRKSSTGSTSSRPSASRSSATRKPAASSSTTKKPAAGNAAAKKPVVSTAAKKTTAPARKPLTGKYGGAQNKTTFPAKAPVVQPAPEAYTPLQKFKNKSNPGTVILVSNLPDSGYTDQDILKIVQPFGKVCDILIVRSKNEAYLETNFKEAAIAAVKFSETNPVVINNKQVTLRLAGQKDEPEKMAVSESPVETPVQAATPAAKTTPKAETKKEVAVKGAAAGKAPEKNKKEPKEVPPGFVKCYKLTEPKIKDSEKCVVLISNLPESNCTVDDLSNLAKPFGGVTDLLVISTHRKAYLELASKNSVDSMIKFYSVFPTCIGGNLLSITVASKYKDVKDEERIFTDLIEQSQYKITPNIYEKFVLLNNLPEKGYTEFEVVCVGLRFGKVEHYAIFSNKKRAILHMCRPSSAKSMFTFLKQYPCCIGETVLTCTLPTKTRLKEDEYTVSVELEKSSDTESNNDETEVAQTAEEARQASYRPRFSKKNARWRKQLLASNAAADTATTTSTDASNVSEPATDTASATTPETATDTSVTVSATVPDVEMAAAPDTEPGSTAVTEPDANSVKEPDANSVKEPDVNAIKEPDANAINEPDVNAVTEPVITCPDDVPMAVDESSTEQKSQIDSEVEQEELPIPKDTEKEEKEVVSEQESSTGLGTSGPAPSEPDVLVAEDNEEEEEEQEEEEEDDDEAAAAEAPEDYNMTSPVSSCVSEQVEDDRSSDNEPAPLGPEELEVLVTVESDTEEDEAAGPYNPYIHMLQTPVVEAKMMEDLVTASEETEEAEACQGSHCGIEASQIDVSEEDASEMAAVGEPDSCDQPKEEEVSKSKSKTHEEKSLSKDSRRYTSDKSKGSSQSKYDRKSGAKESDQFSSSPSRSRTAKYNPHKGELSVTVLLDSQKSSSKTDTRKRSQGDRSSGRESSTPRSNSNRSSPSESSKSYPRSSTSSSLKRSSGKSSFVPDKESRVTPRSREWETRSSNRKDDRFKGSSARYSRSSKSSNYTQKPKEAPEEEFPFNLDEFVTVDEIVEDLVSTETSQDQKKAPQAPDALRKGKRREDEIPLSDAKKAKGRSAMTHGTNQDLSYVTLDEVGDEEAAVGSESTDTLALGQEDPQCLVTVDEVHVYDVVKDSQVLMTLDEISEGEEEAVSPDSASGRVSSERPEDFAKEQQLLTLDEIGVEDEEPNFNSSSLQIRCPQNKNDDAEDKDSDNLEGVLVDQVAEDPTDQPLFTLDEVKGDDVESLPDQFLTVDEIGEEDDSCATVSEATEKSKDKSETDTSRDKTPVTPRRGKPRKRPASEQSTGQ